MPEVYVHAVEGRSLEQKRALIQDITAAVAMHFGITPENVMVQIVEAPKHNKAKDGVLFSERPPSYRVESRGPRAAVKPAHQARLFNGADWLSYAR
jgi:4-oxalocrotonate tautomerase